MDPKVYGKLLTHHRRGYGVDVEALCDRFPSGGASEKAPRWDLTGLELCIENQRERRSHLANNYGPEGMK